MYYYIILSNKVPANPYEIQKGYALKPVKPSKEMWEGFTLGSLPPHHYDAVMAFPYTDSFSYNVYRDLIMFHSFVRDDPETYVYGEYAFAYDKAFEDSNLRIHNSRSAQKIDFDHFPMTIVSDSQILDEEFEEFDEATKQKTLSECERSAKWIPEPSEEINYKKAFRLFTKLKTNKKKRKLYDQIYLYVYLHSLHDSPPRFYSNDHMTVAFYIAILESVVGEPDQCTNKSDCSTCKRKEIWHYKESLEGRFEKEFGDSFKNLKKIRNKVFHGSAFLDISDPLYEIYYERLIRRKMLEKGLNDAEKKLLYKQEKKSLEDEKKLAEYEHETEKLRLTVRRSLVERFLQEYRQ